MRTLRFGTYALFLVVVLWGTLLGGITYSHLVYFPVYLSALPDSAVVVNGPYGLDDAVFWMSIHPLLILSLIVALILNWKSRPRRNLILISFAIYIVVIVVTQIYFLPELGAFESSAGSNLSRAEWLTRGQRWQRLSWIRGAVMYVTILPLLLALTKPANIPKESVAAAAIGKKTLTGPSRHQRALAIQESIREILWHDWDPIGVNDVPEASDEYDAYVGGVYRLLASRCSAEQLIDHLFNIETRTMGLTTPGCEHLRPVAAKLLRLNVSL